MQTRIQQLEEQIRNLTQELEGYRTYLSQVTSTNTALQQTLQQKELELQQRDIELSQLRTQASAVDVQALNEQIQQLSLQVSFWTMQAGNSATANALLDLENKQLKEQALQFPKTISELQLQLTTVTNERSTLQQQLTLATNELVKVTQGYKEIATQLKQQKTNHDLQLKTLGEKLVNAANEKKLLEEKLRSFQIQLSEQHRHQQGSVLANQNLQSQVNGQQAHIDSLQIELQRVSQLGQSDRQEKLQAQQQFHRLKTEYGKTLIKLQEASQNEEKLNRQLIEITTLSTQNQNEIKKLEEAAEEAQKTIISLKAQVAVLTSENQKQLDTAEESKQKIVDLQSQVSTLTSENQNLKDDLVKEKQSNQEKIKDLEKSLSDEKKRFNGLNRSNGTTTATLKKLQSTHTELAKAAATRKEDSTRRENALLDELEQMKQLLMKKEAEVEEAQASQKQSLMDAQNKQKQLDELTKKLKKSEQKNSKQADQLIQLQKELAKSKQTTPQPRSLMAEIGSDIVDMYKDLYTQRDQLRIDKAAQEAALVKTKGLYEQLLRTSATPPSSSSSNSGTTPRSTPPTLLSPVQISKDAEGLVQHGFHKPQAVRHDSNGANSQTPGQPPATPTM